MDIWCARVWVVDHIIKIQIKGNKIHPNPPYTIQGWNIKDSWWYWFKHKHPRLTTILLALEVYITQGFTSEVCNSSHQNLIFLNNQHNCPTYYIWNCDEMGIQYGQEWKAQVLSKKGLQQVYNVIPKFKEWWLMVKFAIYFVKGFLLKFYISRVKRNRYDSIIYWKPKTCMVGMLFHECGAWVVSKWAWISEHDPIWNIMLMSTKYLENIIWNVGDNIWWYGGIFFHVFMDEWYLWIKMWMNNENGWTFPWTLAFTRNHNMGSIMENGNWQNR